MPPPEPAAVQPRTVGAVHPAAVPIPASAARRPLVAGLVAPYVNVRLADGGVDFRTPHTAAYERCWRDHLCQTCGNPLGHLCVLFGGPNQLRNGRFDEPPLCPPCAVYASQACPMVSGQLAAYATGPALAAGRRGHTCPDAGCDCGGFTDADPTATGSPGAPAHPWYALYMWTGGWQLTARKVRIPCSDRGCLHDRLLISGCQLTAAPRKVVLVSEPGAGRVWRRLTPDEVAALTTGPPGTGRAGAPA